jgi:hypothetical protein
LDLPDIKARFAGLGVETIASSPRNSMRASGMTLRSSA